MNETHKPKCQDLKDVVVVALVLLFLSFLA